MIPTIPDWLGILCLILFVLMVVLHRGRQKRSGRTALNGDPLDDELCRWTGKDIFSVRSLLASCLGIGATGSGKSSGAARWLAEAIMHHKRSSCLVLAAKPEDADDWRRYAVNAERELVVFEPDGDWRFGLLDFIQREGGDARQVTRCLMSIGETLRGSDTNGREDGDFWEREQERAIYHSLVVLKLAEGHISGPALQEFLTGAPITREEMGSDQWKAGRHNEWMRAAYHAKKTKREEHDFDLAKKYFQVELPGMADRTRSSIMVGVFGLLHQFNTGIVRELLSEGTNVTPRAMLDEGKTILVNLPPAKYGDTGNFVNAAWKFATQWTVLRRKAIPEDFYNVIFVDEAQQFVNQFDGHYLAQCRSHLGCMVYFAQSRDAFFSALGTHSEHKANALLANFNLKILNAVGTPEDAKWCSDLAGREIKTMYGGSVTPTGGLWEQAFGKDNLTSSFSTHFEPVLEPKVFMHGLRTGGAKNRYVVDAILVKTGEAFADGRNWMQVSFSQR